jgi:hypothetical protein
VLAGGKYIPDVPRVKHRIRKFREMQLSMKPLSENSGATAYFYVLCDSGITRHEVGFPPMTSGRCRGKKLLRNN